VATIGIDIGGTTTRVGLVDETGRLLAVQRLETPRSGDALLHKLSVWITSIGDSAGAQPVAGIGLAVAGLVDPSRELVTRSVNLPFLVDYPLVEELARRANCKISIHTDANAATWGEYCASLPPSQGATRKSFPPLPEGIEGGYTFVHLRLGTGIACGIVADGRLQPTDQPRTTHWNVLVVEHGPTAIACPCGLRGCLETIASGMAIQQRATALGLPDRLASLQAAWARGETGARDFIDEIARAVVGAISSLRSEISNLNSVCLGGGVLSALPCLFEATSTQWAQHPDAGSASLYLARLGDNAGVIGAAMLACT